MPIHAEQRRMPYTPAQMFDLVADVESYADFLPWCVSCRITRRMPAGFEADLVIGYKLIRERLSSRVDLNRPEGEINVTYLSGPMRHLANRWRFISEPDGGCTVDFYVDFEFRNALLQGLMGVFFGEIVRRMVGAFEKRARDLYGR